MTEKRPYPFRWTIYVDKTGVIRKIDKKVKPASAGQDLVAALTELDAPKAE